MQRRFLALQRIERDPDLQVLEYEYCRRDCKRFLTNWGWTFDPRNAAIGLPAYVPFDLFPRQEEMIDFLDARLAARQDGLIEKSRDVGFTWVAGGWCVHHWLYTPGFKATFGSRIMDLVDKIDDPDSIFEKIRQLIRRLPPFLTPRGFVMSLHGNYMRLVNPENDNVIRGEGGQEMGRGGRNTVYIVDEAAHVPQADRVDAATSANTDCRIWASSVDGMGNLFARKRFGGVMRPEQIFRFHYTDDPRMTPDRVMAKKEKLEDWAWNAEYEIDYSASVEGICIPAKWVQACQEIQAECLKHGIVIEPLINGISGLDVGGGGKAKSVHVARFGPVTTIPEGWPDGDTIDTADRGVSLAKETELKRSTGEACRVRLLNFDSVGVGAGVMARLKRGAKGLMVGAINVGDTPSEAKWPDGETSQDKFANLKCELWWKARARAKASFEMLLCLRGQGGQRHLPSDLLTLPHNASSKDAMLLTTQMSLPKVFKNEKGKLQMETKLQLSSRGIASPDHAESFMLTFAESNVLDTWRRAFGGARA